jgi:hypothetical protein
VRALLVLLWCALFWLFGCAHVSGSSAPMNDGQEQAVWIIWHDVYGRNDMPPLVRWRQGDQLTCDDPQSGKRGFPIVEYDPADPVSAPAAKCREGLTWGPLEVLVAWHGEISFGETALAHELEHAELLRRGIFLGHHERPDFFSRIDAANAAVVAAGR